MLTVHDLPDDVLIDVLARQGAVRVAQLQRVCRRWRTLSAASTYVWRDALFVEHGLRDPTVFALAVRLGEIAKRAEGRVDRVGLRMCFVEQEYDDKHRQRRLLDKEGIGCMMRLLSIVNVKTLYIYFDRHVYDGSVALEWLKQLNELANDTIESLILTFSGLFLEDAGTVRCAEEWTGFRMNGLQFLRLQGTIYPGILQSCRASNSLPALRRIHFDICPLTANDSQGLYLLLFAVQDTLEELVLEHCPSPFHASRDDVACTDIVFRNLHTLHLHCDSGASVTGQQAYRFVCPRLRTGLSLVGANTLRIFGDLLTPHIESLHLAFDASSSYDVYADVLSRCSGLHTLFLDFVADWRIVKYVLPQLLAGPLPKHIFIHGNRDFPMDRLVQQLRMAMTTAAPTSICIVFCADSSTEWLRDEFKELCKVIEHAVFFDSPESIRTFFPVRFPSRSFDYRLDNWFL